jgi:ATP-dependent Lhr-like helicase
LLQTEHLEQTDIGSLIIGYKADRFVNNYRFYATFEDEITYQVRDASREIGTIQSAPDIGTTIVLAGFIWRVKNVNKDKRIIDVVRVSGQAKTYWMGDAPEVHTKILLKMREILRSDSQYAYLHDRASVLLSNVRAIAYKNNLANDSILSIAPNRFIIFPWCGTRAFATQLLLLQSVGIKVISSFSPYYYEISYKADTAKQVQLKFAEIIAHPAKPSELVELVNDWDLRRYKYDRYVPLDLLKESYASDFFDVEGAIESLQNL